MPQPEPIPMRPRRDDTAADADTLEEMGRLDEQPVPAPSISPFLEPDYQAAEGSPG
ncbi:hypothetical protein [Streptomyces sp. SAS_275]|uniref:hypothetical protein n=1 Tax=Streptomyces sp. SAS_275 TaxID=3412746 RepID=UPI00403C046C